MIRWERKLKGATLAVALMTGLAWPASAGPSSGHQKVDGTLSGRAGQHGTSRVIVTFQPGSDASDEVRRLGGSLGRRLESINGRAIELPNAAIRRLADHPAIRSLHLDRPTGGEMNRAAVTVGARAVQSQLGLTGAGVGVAVIDSGITSWHDDLRNSKKEKEQRVAAFVDFVNGRTSPYDDNGHGTHVAGIIASNGANSLGDHAGIAPGAHLVALKVLDDRGRGVISNVIAAIDWVLANRTTHNIRIVNLSVGAAVTESFRTDPLTLAAKRLVDAGVVVVTAAGNLGRTSDGRAQYGAITAPGNAPWVLTVGAYHHQNTVHRSDDVMARYSSRGPTAIDYAAKPDLVAPGTATVSLTDPASLMHYTRADSLVDGAYTTSYRPYLRLSGTSMAAPIVSGTVALMLQANPSLTPNLVKAILQYTAEHYSGHDLLTQGAGFLNSYGAVALARFYAIAKSGDQLSIPGSWSRQIIWGNRRISRGIMVPNGSAFAVGTTWGATVDLRGQNVVWGTGCSDSSCDNIVWGTSDNIVWGTSDNIVWGTNVVWGTTCDGGDCDNIVWGTHDNIVWGTDDNIVWGTSGLIDPSVWGASAEYDNVTWGTALENDGASGSSSY